MYFAVLKSIISLQASNIKAHRPTLKTFVLSRKEPQKGKKINNVVGYILKILQIGIYQSVSSEELSKNIYHDEIQEKESRSNLNANNIVKTFFNDCRIKWGDAIYKSWILHLQYIQHNDEQVVFTVNSNFIKKWLDENYAGYFLKLWQSYIPSIKQFIIQVVKN